MAVWDFKFQWSCVARLRMDIKSLCENIYWKSAVIIPVRWGIEQVFGTVDAVSEGAPVGKEVPGPGPRRSTARRGEEGPGPGWSTASSGEGSWEKGDMAAPLPLGWTVDAKIRVKGMEEWNHTSSVIHLSSLTAFFSLISLSLYPPPQHYTK